MKGLMFFVVFGVFGQVSECHEILEISAENSSFSNPVFLCFNTLGDAYFKGSIKTDVCKDSLCELMELNVIWDLAGNYKNIDTIPGLPLTKYDHEPFSEKDYLKLHNILKNGNSLLGYRNKKELIDNSISDYSEKVDGVSGATSKEIKSAVVEGAVYSTYTLWHLVNGTVVNQLKDHINSNYGSKFQNQLLTSTNPKTILFVLRKFNDQDYFDNFDKVLHIMNLNIPMINFYIAKNLPSIIFAEDRNIKAIQTMWYELDRNTQSVLAKSVNPKN